MQNLLKQFKKQTEMRCNHWHTVLLLQRVVYHFTVLTVASVLCSGWCWHCNVYKVQYV